MMEFITQYAEHIITALIAVNVFLCARNNIWNWPIGLVAVTAYGTAAWFMWGLYADAMLQIFYFLTGIIGWIYWCKGGKNKTEAPVTDFSALEWIAITVAVAAVTYGLGAYLKTATNSVVPYLDAYTTVICLFAQLGLMLRKRSSWLLWIAANVVYVYMFYVKGLNLLAIEYAVFMLNAAYGYYVWTKDKKEKCVGISSFLTETC